MDAMSALTRAVDDDKAAVPCVSCGRPTVVPGGLCVRCWPPRRREAEAAAILARAIIALDRGYSATVRAEVEAAYRLLAP